MMEDDEPKESVEVTPNGELMYCLTFTTPQFFDAFIIFICAKCELPSSEDETGLKKCEHCGEINYSRNIHLFK